MYLKFYLNEEGKRVYTLQVSENNFSEPTRL